MPLIDGAQITKSIKMVKNEKFEERQVKFLVAQLVIGIGYLHEQSIMHCDIKMSNLLLDNQGYLKIIGFGKAKVLRHNQEELQPRCSPQYSPPEIVLGQAFDMSADWWAVGVVAYALMFGVAPFADSN